MKLIKSLSIAVPFYNEEKSILDVAKVIKKLIKHLKLKNYEVIFINDASTDSSQTILKNFIKSNKNFFLVKNSKNKGLGYCIKKGIISSKKNFFLWIPGDDEHPLKGLKKLFTNFGEYDITIPYVKNPKIRNIKRRFFSKFYTLLLNILFFNKFKYLNGLVLYRTKILKSFINKVENNSMTFHSEILLRALSLNSNYQIIHYELKKSKKKNSSINLKKIIECAYSILKLRLSI